jgi:FimV-like protein
MANKLNQAVRFIEAGKEAQARRLLTEVLKSDPTNEEAWVLMATVAETYESRKKCLQEALRLNPRNQTALKGLESLKRRPKHAPLNSTLTLPKTQPSYGILKGIAYAVGALAVTIFILGIALFLLRDQLSSDAGWREFAPEEGRFSILVPRTPRKTTETTETQIGTIDTHIFVVTHGDFTYIMVYNDFPQRLINSSDSRAMLNGARDGAVESLGGRLLSENSISINGFPGRELKVKVSEGPYTSVAQVRIYLVRNRLYQIYAIAPEARASSPDVKKFLDSFKLLR